MSAAASPGGGCFGHPISGAQKGRRFCGARAVATIVMLDEPGHPDWRACHYHAEGCLLKSEYAEVVRVEWDEGQGPRRIVGQEGTA